MGQMSEVAFMLVMPFFFARLGVKKMLLVGMLAWAARYVLFALGNPADLVFMYYLGILLHGICYDFFFVTGQIYVDKTAPKSIQASAQGFITLVTYGVGMLIGAWVSGPVVDLYATTSGQTVTHDWSAIWLWPAAMAFLIILLFAFFFRETRSEGRRPSAAA
jgi:MFS family permease